MAGKIIADTLEHSTAGSIATNYVVEGVAKAWINFNGTGTPASRKTFNTSSITDNGTGQFRISIVSAMSDADFALIGSCIGDGSTSNRTVSLMGSRGSNTTSIMDVNTTRADTDAQVDWTHNSAATFGDLA